MLGRAWIQSERVDEYGLGVRKSLAEAVNAVISILGMQPCEVSPLVFIPPAAG
jgi:coatomer subunit gamma